MTPPPVEPGPELAIDARGLVKRFGTFTALDGLELQIPRGAFYAFLGPNGAGKSTSIALLTGVYGPDQGSIRMLGVDAVAKPLEVKQRVGVVPEELSLFERLTGRQYLTFCARMYGLDGAQAASRAVELLELTELTYKAGALVSEYSKGMRRRLAIAAALIHAPELVLLDEPFEGIDVLAAGVIRELLRELSRRGVTLLLTTHVLEIAERLATHAGVIRGGRMLDQGPVEQLRQRHGVATLEAVFEKLISVPAARNAKLSFYGEPPANVVPLRRESA
ncbi:ABC transporter ATP-binding protein [Corallococcus carmarthensis]|uniref:ABC transporter ATP-binding protein n=1 Tax=Corallococcus carmarthensis TaxID=2316728 RepID=A0A3A8JSB4_9BACT|nr:ABC transporter ATP-binding protein [Corallococcus carmarthensis]NOK22704.1 ABC transporter ATP-binding protein [Corallococcus carmarthensis]RKG94630.1 ABC transporter ATP-binding protein [Corallococcus carmarthensis]